MKGLLDYLTSNAADAKVPYDCWLFFVCLIAGIRWFSIGLSETIKADHVEVDYINCNCFLVHLISAKMSVFLAKFTYNLDYQRCLFFLSLSSGTRETRKWPRTWLKARDWRGFAARRSRAHALPSLNLKKNRDCSQSTYNQGIQTYPLSVDLFSAYSHVRWNLSLLSGLKTVKIPKRPRRWPCAYSYSEKGCRKKCTRQSRKVLWVILNALFFKEIWKNGTGGQDVCLRVLKESNKSSFDSYSRQEQCIDHIPYYFSGLSRAHFFRQPFSK